MEERVRTMREICEETQESFYKANGYYPTEEEAVRLTDEARKEIAQEKAERTAKRVAEEADE